MTDKEMLEELIRRTQARIDRGTFNRYDVSGLLYLRDARDEFSKMASLGVKA